MSASTSTGPSSNSRALMFRLLGMPGSGKTTTMFGPPEDEDIDVVAMLDELRSDGYEYRDIIVASFTRAHTEELRERYVSAWRDVAEDAENPDEVYDRLESSVRTLNSHVLSQLYRGEMFDEDDTVITLKENYDFYADYFGSRGIEVRYSKKNPLEMWRNGGLTDSLGNKILAADQWLVQHCYDLDDVARIPIEIGFPAPQVRDFIQGWRDYKQENRCWEHHDYMEYAREWGVIPTGSVAFIDEYQDYAPLEHAIIKMWRDSGSFDRIVIAGDDAQSIYSFKGAQPVFLMKTPVDEEWVLPASYRCRANVANVCAGILDEPMQTHRTDTMGSASLLQVNRESDVVDAVMSALEQYDDVMLLARTGRYVGQVADMLIEAGVPFRSIGERMGEGKERPWADWMINLAVAMRSIEGNDSPFISRLVADDLVEHLVNSTERRKNMVFHGDTTVDLRSVIPEVFGSGRDVTTLLDISEERKDMLRGVMSSDVSLQPDRVKVGTVHSAKGGQGDCVILFSGVSNKLRRRYDEDESFRAEENRIWFVGASRAKYELQVVPGGLVGPETAQPFSHGLPQFYVSAEEVVYDE